MDPDIKAKSIIHKKKNLLSTIVLGTSLFAISCGIMPLSDDSYFSNSENQKQEAISLKYSKMSYRQAIREVKTPQQVTDYETYYLAYESSSDLFVRSFRRVHNERRADCIEASIAAGALLGDNGYDLNYLWMFDDEPEIGHAVFFYFDEKTRLYGTSGIFKTDNNPPVFLDLEEIADYFNYANYHVTEIDRQMIHDLVGVRR